MLLFGQYFPDRSAGGQWNRSIRWVMGGALACFVLLWGVSRALATEDVRAMLFEAAVQRWGTFDVVVAMFAIAVFFANIILKMWRSATPDERRRLKLLVTGSAVSLTPVFLLVLAELLMGHSFAAFVTLSPWLLAPSLLLLFLFPVTLAYVILVAHAMEVNVVIRQGLQYALARGGARFLTNAALVAMAIYYTRVAYDPAVARPLLLVLAIVLAATVLVFAAPVQPSLQLDRPPLFSRGG